ncbi:hypothetical protein B0H13DRAFT_220523 [Mycena leptocephala]|nr:hypothetical protein B0H13DRAFT_220523 [Mycena leptocephala]
MCFSANHYVLRNFQGHVLTLAMNGTAVNSFPQSHPITPDQAWLVQLSTAGTTDLVNQMNITQPRHYVSYDTSLGVGTLHLQAIVTRNGPQALGFHVHCVNATAARLTIGVETGYALTAWPAQSVLTTQFPSPVTFEALNPGLSRQVWNLESLD